MDVNKKILSLKLAKENGWMLKNQKCGDCTNYVAPLREELSHGTCTYNIPTLPASMEATCVRMLPSEGNDCLCWSPRTVVESDSNDTRRPGVCGSQ